MFVISDNFTYITYGFKPTFADASASIILLGSVTALCLYFMLLLASLWAFMQEQRNILYQSNHDDMNKRDYYNKLNMQAVIKTTLGNKILLLVSGSVPIIGLITQIAPLIFK